MIEHSKGIKTKNISVLSLFDGMACGLLAMQKAGIEVNTYDAYEIVVL